MSEATQNSSPGEGDEMLEKRVVCVPKAAYLDTPPYHSTTTYKQFKSSQPLTCETTPKKKPHLYGDMPSRYDGAPPPHSHHYHHQYYSPPSPPKKRVSEHINTPRFQERPPSPRPGPGQYRPSLSVCGPQFSFGRKLGEKDSSFGRGRTSWEKAWFASDDVWKIKTHFEDKWPEIGDYQFNCMGKKLPYITAGPSPSFGMKLPELDKQRSPHAYDIINAQKLLYTASPSYTMVRKDYSFEPWVKNKNVPGPGKYMPNIPAVKPKIPAFSFAKPLTNMVH